MITIDVDEFTDLFGDNGELWIQDQWQNDDGQMCMHEGIKRCTKKRPGDFHLISQVAIAEGWGTGWNDAGGRTWDEVKAKVFDRAEIGPDRLEAVFGPQWAEIVALVRRVAVLTVDETARLEAVRPSASGPELYMAWSSARDATALGPARHAGSIAAMGAALGSELPNAVGDAATALAIRDRIGQCDFTQERYDLLTEAWATAMGPVHPDDKRERLVRVYTSRTEYTERH